MRFAAFLLVVTIAACSPGGTGQDGGDRSDGGLNLGGAGDGGVDAGQGAAGPPCLDTGLSFLLGAVWLPVCGTPCSRTIDGQTQAEFSFDGERLSAYAGYGELQDGSWGLIDERALAHAEDTVTISRTRLRGYQNASPIFEESTLVVALDDAGRPTSATETMCFDTGVVPIGDALLDLGDCTYDFERDEDGRLLAIERDAAFSEAWLTASLAYDAQGRLSSVTADIGIDGDVDRRWDYEYLGDVVERRYRVLGGGTDVTDTLSFDADGKLLSLYGGYSLQTTTYQHDDACPEG